MNILKKCIVVNIKNIICIFANCIASYFWFASGLAMDLYKKLSNGNFAFISDILPVVIISAVFSFVGGKNIKTKVLDFFKLSLISYILVVVIALILVSNSMSKFD